MNDSFVFYRSFYEAINELPSEDQLKVYNAIFEYALNGEDHTLSGVNMIVFRLVKPAIDASIKNRRDGKKGGRPKKEKTPLLTPVKTPVKTYEDVDVNEDVDDNGGINPNAPDRRPLNLDHVRSATKGICKRKKRNIDETKVAEDFYTHYQANNWTHNNDPAKPIHDWIAKLEQWIGRENEKKAVKHDPDLP